MTLEPDERVSAVVITRERVECLLVALAKLAALPEAPPLVVVDNASGDRTADAVSRRFPRARVVALGHNLGAAARNVGVELSRTPYAAFSDDDSWWAPGSLALAADLLDRHPSLAVVGARVLVGPAATLDPSCRLMARSPLRQAPGLPGRAILGFLACGAVVRRSAFTAVGGFEPRYGLGAEEQLLAIDLARAGHRLAYVPEVVAYHHPARGGDRPSTRRVEVMRNDLWFAWLRRRLPEAARQTASLGLRAARDAQSRTALREAAHGGGWVLRARRPVDKGLERDLRRLAEQRRATRLDR